VASRHAGKPEQERALDRLLAEYLAAVGTPAGTLTDPDAVLVIEPRPVAGFGLITAHARTLPVVKSGYQRVALARRLRHAPELALAAIRAQRTCAGVRA